MTNNMIGSLIRLKLNVSEKLIGKLPESIGPHIRELRSDILGSLNEEISDYLKKGTIVNRKNCIKKVELD